MIMDLIQEIMDAIVAVDSDRICYARCSHGGWCGLDAGHDGDHDSDGHCRWPQS